MTDWRIHATDAERQRLKEIELMGDALKAEKRKIYDRCRKRMAKGEK